MSYIDLMKTIYIRILILILLSGNTYSQKFTELNQKIFFRSNANTTAWADFDNDNDFDLAVAFDNGNVSLYQNNDGNFIDVTAEYNLPNIGAPARGLSWGDYNNDGNIDLYVSYVSWYSYESNRLFRNDLSKFTDVTEQTGIAFYPAFSRQANWIDYDGDGDLDLFSAQRQGENRLFKNNNGVFIDISKDVGLYDPRRTVGSCWADFDKDGDLDLFNANQQSDKDAFYMNENGKFIDIARKLGIDQPDRTIYEGGVACTVVDFDNDGNLDLFVGTYGYDYLYKGNGDGTFDDVSHILGINKKTKIVGSSWGDFNNDGSIDLYYTSYVIGEEHGSDGLLKNINNSFKNVIPINILDKDGDHGVVWIDYDGDGDLDLNITSNGITIPSSESSSNNSKGNHLIFENKTETVPGRSIQLLILDKNGNFNKYGSEIRVYSANSEEILGTRIVESGNGYNTQNAIPIHFGFEEPMIVDVEVTFLTNNKRQIKKYKNILTKSHHNKVIIIRE